MKTATTSTTGPRRRRNMSFDTSFLTRHMHGPARGAADGTNTSANPATSGRQEEDLRGLLIVVGLFLMGVVPRLVFGVSAAIPVESVIPVKFALVNALAEGEESYTIKTGLWLDALLVGAATFFLVPDPGSVNLLAFLALVVAILPTMGTRFNLLLTAVPVGMFAYRFAVTGPPTTAGAADQKLYWTVASCLCSGLCAARCLRLNPAFMQGRDTVSKTVTDSVLAAYKVMAAIPFVGAVGRVFYNVAGKPITTVCQAMGLKWPIAVTLWLSTMMLEWGVQVSEGGIIVTGSLLMGFVTSLLEDRRSGSIKGKAFFVCIVLAVNAFVWAVCPSRALSFLANAVISAYLILYVAYLKPTRVAAPVPPTSKKAVSVDPQVEIYTNLSTVLLMAVWISMLGADLTQQVNLGWPTPGLYRMVLSVNTIGYGTVMLVTALFDLVNKELHQGAALRQQREKVEALSTTLKNSTQNGTKVVLTKGNHNVNPLDGEEQVPKRKKEDDGGETAAPSTSATPEDAKTESSQGSAPPTPFDTDEEVGAVSNAVAEDSLTTPITADPEPSEVVDEQPMAVLAETPTPTEVKDSFSSAPGSTTAKLAVASPASQGLATPTIASSTPHVANKKRSKAEIERERKEWQEAQLSAVLAEGDDDAVEVHVSTKPKKERDTKKAKKEAAAAAEKEKKSKEDSLAALRLAAQREQELKEKLEADRRERERKVQEEQLKKQHERERQEAVRQKEVERSKKEKQEQADLQKKKERELELQREKEAKAKAEERERKEREKKERAAAKEKAKKEEEEKAKQAAAEKHAAEHPLLPGAGEASPTVGPPAVASPLGAGKSMADLIRDKQHQKQGGKVTTPRQHVIVTGHIKSAPDGQPAVAKPSKTKKAAAELKTNTKESDIPEQSAGRGGPPMAICSVDDLSSPTEARTAVGGLMTRNQAARSSVPSSPVIPSGTVRTNSAGLPPLPPPSADIDISESAGFFSTSGGTSSCLSPPQPMAVDAEPEAQPPIKGPSSTTFLQPSVFEEDDSSGAGTPAASPADSNPMSADDRHNFLFSLLSSSKEESGGTVDPLHLTSPNAALAAPAVSVLSPTLRTDSDSFVPGATAVTADPIGGQRSSTTEDVFGSAGDDDAFWRNINSCVDTVLSETQAPPAAPAALGGPTPLAGLGGPLLSIDPHSISPAKTTAPAPVSGTSPTSVHLHQPLQQQPLQQQVQAQPQTTYMLANGQVVQAQSFLQGQQQQQQQQQQPAVAQYYLQPNATNAQQAVGTAQQQTQQPPQFYMPQQTNGTTLFQLGGNNPQGTQQVYVIQQPAIGGAPAYQQVQQAAPPQYSAQSGPQAGGKQ